MAAAKAKRWYLIYNDISSQFKWSLKAKQWEMRLDVWGPMMSS